MYRYSVLPGQSQNQKDSYVQEITLLTGHFFGRSLSKGRQKCSCACAMEAILGLFVSDL